MKTWQASLSDQRVSRFARETSRPFPFAWATSGSLPSVPNYRPYLLFLSSCGYRNILFAKVFFCLWLVIGTYILLFLSCNFFDLMCELKYLSFFPSPMNPILAIIFYISLSYETILLMLSCDRIESAKLIHGTLSLAKLVYYSISFLILTAMGKLLPLLFF